jgi:transposase
MRGVDIQNIPTFVLYDIEARLPQDHPLRTIKALVDPILERLSPEFEKMYSWTGRPSIPPEQLLRAMILQTLYTIRSERLLVEEIDFNLAYRWFVGLRMDEPMWVATVFTKNRDRLLENDIARRFFEEIRMLMDESGIASDEHFSVDGTQLEAWASMKSFQWKGKEKDKSKKSDDDPGNPTVDFKGEKRCNDTHQSKTDPDCRLNRKGKGKEAKLAYFGNLLIENRNGLVMQAEVLRASGTAEEEAALSMVDRERKWQKAKKKRLTLGADKKYDNRGFIQAARKRFVTPHVAQREDRRSAVDERTTRHPGYIVSQRKRKRIEEVFGWGKTIGLLRKLVYRGLELVNWVFILKMGVYNLVRMKNLGVVSV